MTPQSSWTPRNCSTSDIRRRGAARLGGALRRATTTAAKRHAEQAVAWGRGRTSRGSCRAGALRASGTRGAQPPRGRRSTRIAEKAPGYVFRTELSSWQLVHAHGADEAAVAAALGGALRPRLLPRTGRRRILRRPRASHVRMPHGSPGLSRVEQMEYVITFPGGLRVDARYKDVTIQTDQTVKGGGEGSAPHPFMFFLSSIGTCAGFYVLQFCRSRDLPTDGIRPHAADDAGPRDASRHDHLDRHSRSTDVSREVSRRSRPRRRPVHGEEALRDPTLDLRADRRRRLNRHRAGRAVTSVEEDRCSVACSRRRAARDRRHARLRRRRHVALRLSATAQLQSRYGFTPTPEWLRHVQRSVLTTGGGTASFVSPDGLVLTNHHVAYGQIEKLSSPEHDYVRDGFFSARAPKNQRCAGLELKLLWETQDVTAQVRAVMTGPGTPRRQREAQGAAHEARSRVREEDRPARGHGAALPGRRCWLYAYKTFDDVRLVYAPDEQAANFGGDPDNFGFPRHDLDFAFYRIYENGQPYHPEHWLRVCRRAASPGRPRDARQSPGRTNRLRTAAQLEYERDLDRRSGSACRSADSPCTSATPRSAEQERRSRNAIRGLENNLKRERGFLAAAARSVVLRDEARRGRSCARRLAKRPDPPPNTATRGTAWPPRADRTAHALARAFRCARSAA